MCPCQDPACENLRAHDVRAQLQLQINLPALLAGIMEGTGASGD